MFAGEDLIPNRTNLLLNAKDLRELIATRQRNGSRSAGGLGLVLAYIGWQLDDRSMVDDGLDVMQGSKRAGLWEGLSVVWRDGSSRDDGEPEPVD